MNRLAVVVATALVVACSGLAEVETPLELSLDMPVRVVAHGDSVVFHATAHNPTDRTVEIASAFGSPLDVIVVTPEAERISVYDLMLDGSIPAGAGPYNRYPGPGESVTLRFAWKATDPGVYGAYAQTRCSTRHGPCPRTVSMPFTVR